MNKTIKRNKSRLLVKFIISISLGALIYILFRCENLLVFTWLENIGFEPYVMNIRSSFSCLHPFLPNWFLYSLPDGLWVYGSTALFGAIWIDDIKPMVFWIFIPITCAVFSEAMQFPQIIEGTFCWIDIFTYLFSFLLILYEIIKLKGGSCYVK